MQAFQLRRADTADTAIRGASNAKTAQQGADIRFLAGGTTLLDLMKLNVETPQQIIDINHLPLDKIEPIQGGGLLIGATVRNADLANDERVKRDYPVLSQALLAGASAQLRNMATTGGNLLQRTRCVYFRDTDMACNKRNPGSGCAAIGGFNRNLAILGVSDQCIATNPSDMNVALMALDATIHIKGANGERTVPISEFFLLPGNTPDKETMMQPGDLITHAGVSITLSEAARSRVVRICPRLSRRGDDGERRQDRQRGLRHGRCRCAALAQQGRRSQTCWPDARQGDLRRRSRGFSAGSKAAERQCLQG
jgi:xanthine dehydrogenase YagS FAD-binding subunit